MGKYKFSIVQFIILLPVVFFLSLSCGPKTIGYGVVIWSPEEEIIATGSVIPVINESEINKNYTVSLEKDETYELPLWRLQFFKNEKEANAYLQENNELTRTVALAKIDALAVRIEPEPMTQRVYKLRQLETVKVIERQDELVKVGDYEDYWYKVLTENGTEGWCYGHSLILKEIGDETVSTSSEEQIDDSLAIFLEKEWRPEYFKTAIENNTIDFEEFRTDIGIFPNPEEKKVLHVTKDYVREYEYDEIVDAGNSLYLFSGATIKVKIYTPERIMFEYLENGKTVQELYVQIEENIEEVVQMEQERRWNLFSYLTSDGNILRSEAYGTITIDNYTKFTWTDFDPLVPDVIPQSVKNGTGKLEFGIFLDDKLKSKYTGAFLLNFDEVKGPPMAIMFNRTADGVQLTYTTPTTIEGVVIKRESASPIVMYFTIQGE